MPSLTFKAIAATVLVLAVADLGFFSIADGAVIAFVIACILPILAPYLLLTIAVLQDTPGLAGPFWYIAFITVGAVTILDATKKAPIFWRSEWGIFATITISYGIIVSLIHVLSGGYPQSQSRPPFALGILMVFMVWSGLAAARRIKSLPEGPNIAGFTVGVLLIHGLSVGIAQAVFSPTILASLEGVKTIESAVQLYTPTQLGFPRITGTFLTPNGFALSHLLLILCVLSLRGRNRISALTAATWIFVGAFLVTFSLSKSLVTLYVPMSIVILVMFLRWRRTLNSICIAIVLGALFIIFGIEEIERSQDIVFRVVDDAFRLTAGAADDSYRTIAWSITISELTALDWLTGTGLTYWPELFEKHMGFSMAGPHSWLLFIPGTFGVVGIIFFLMVIAALVLAVRRRAGERRFVALSLIVLLVIRDLFSQSTLIGNTPISFLVWLSIGALFLPNSLQNR